MQDSAENTNQPSVPASDDEPCTLGMYGTGIPLSELDTLTERERFESEQRRGWMSRSD